MTAPVELGGMLGGVIELGYTLLVKSNFDVKAISGLVLNHVDRIWSNQRLRAFLRGAAFKRKQIERLSTTIGRYYQFQVNDLNTIDLMIRIVEFGQKSPQKLKSDIQSSIGQIRLKRGEIILGNPENAALIPDDLKQPEFHEYRYVFLHPTSTKAGLTKVWADPPWFYVIAVGVLLTLGGAFGTKGGMRYYFIVPRNISVENIDKIVEGLQRLTTTNFHVISNYRTIYHSKELYELAMAYHLVVNGMEYPENLRVLVYNTEVVGRAYTLVSVLDFDVFELYRYLQTLADILGDVSEITFIDSMIRDAYYEMLTEGIKTAQTTSHTYPLIKRLHAAIKFKNYKMLLETLYEYLRERRGLQNIPSHLTPRRIKAMISALRGVM